LEHKSPGFPCPFNHKSVVFQSGLAILVPVDTRSLFSSAIFSASRTGFPSLLCCPRTNTKHHMGRSSSAFERLQEQPFV
jgi:hypothetical protein